MAVGDNDLVPTLPHRLRELRKEMGWSLDDVVQKVGVTQRGVVSNWEATNQRRRTPPLATLLELQRWYGVSLDYLVGTPHAERDSPAVKVAKRAVRQALAQLEGLETRSPSDRARVAVDIAAQVAPEVYFDDRLAACLLLHAADYAALREDRAWSDSSLERLAQLLGICRDWFYAPKPSKVLECVE